jgi:hypothetical protein
MCRRRRSVGAGSSPRPQAALPRPGRDPVAARPGRCSCSRPQAALPRLAGALPRGALVKWPSTATRTTGTTLHGIAGRCPPCSSTPSSFFMSGLLPAMSWLLLLFVFSFVFSHLSLPPHFHPVPDHPNLRPIPRPSACLSTAHPAADPDRFSSLMRGGRGRRRQVGSSRSGRRRGGGSDVPGFVPPFVPPRGEGKAVHRTSGIFHESRRDLPHLRDVRRRGGERRRRWPAGARDDPSRGGPPGQGEPAVDGRGTAGGGCRAPFFRPAGRRSRSFETDAAAGAVIRASSASASSCRSCWRS